MPDTNENIDEQAKPVKPTEPAKPAKPAKASGAKKPASTVGLPVFIACVVAAAIVGVLCGHFLLGGGSSFSLGGTTQLTADQLDTVIAEYTYNGKTEKVTARQVISQNGSVESSANSDGSYNVLTAGKQPIPGLYAVGNCCGQRFGVQYHTPTAGNSCGSAMTTGYVAAESVAASLK